MYLLGINPEFVHPRIHSKIMTEDKKERSRLGMKSKKKRKMSSHIDMEEFAS